MTPIPGGLARTVPLACAWFCYLIAARGPLTEHGVRTQAQIVSAATSVYERVRGIGAV